MAERPNNPAVKVRQLRQRLYVAAKRNRKRRFHALFDRIWRGDVLAEAWKRVKANKGAAGVDGQTLSTIEQGGEEGFLLDIRMSISTTYRWPRPPVRRIASSASVVGCGRVAAPPRPHHGMAQPEAAPGKDAYRRAGTRQAGIDRRRWAGMQDIRQVVEVLNPVLRGWGNYFRTGNASWKFQQVDRYVNQRLVRLLRHVRGWRRRPFSLREWSPARFRMEFGLHRLVGTIRYPGFVNAS